MSSSEIPLRSPRLMKTFPARLSARLLLVVTAARVRGVAEAFLRRLPLVDPGLRVALDHADLLALVFGVTKVIARPVRPTLPVRPIRCT